MKLNIPNITKRKKFDSKDFVIQSNYSEIFYPKIHNNSEPYELKMKEEKENATNKMQYFPIVTNESLKGNPTIYLATEKSEKIIKNNNKNCYDNYCINSRNKKLKNKLLMNLRKNIKAKCKTDRKDNLDKNIIIKLNKEPYYQKTECIQHNKIYNKGKSEIEPKKLDCLSHSYSLDSYVELNNKLLLKFHKNLENSEILGQKFINGIKNARRKNNLMNAIEKYKRFKSLGKLTINNYLNNAFSNEFGFDSDICNKRNTERIHTYDKNNSKIIEEENENEKKKKKKRPKRSKKIKEINKTKLKNIIYLRKPNSTNNTNNIETQNKNRIKSDLSSYIINNKKKYYIKNIKKYINPNKENENIIKEPKILVRRILREERYIIDENGKEKLLAVNQSFLPKKINLNKLETMDKLNIRTNTKNDLDEQIIEKEKYKNDNKNNIINNKRKLMKTNSQNIFNEQSKKSLVNITSYDTNTNKSINGNILQFLQRKEKPILIKKLPNKIEKKNVIKLNEMNNLNSKSFLYGKKEQTGLLKKTANNNHFYHEIKSFREKERECPINSPIQNFQHNKKLSVNNSTRQIKSLKNSFDLNFYNKNSNKNCSAYFSEINSEKNRGDTLKSNDNAIHDIERTHHKNYSIHEIIDLRNKTNKKNNINNKSFKYSKKEETKNSNTIYADTSPNINNNFKSDNIYTQYYKYKLIH